MIAAVLAAMPRILGEGFNVDVYFFANSTSPAVRAAFLALAPPSEGTPSHASRQVLRAAASLVLGPHDLYGAADVAFADLGSTIKAVKATGVADLESHAAVPHHDASPASQLLGPLPLRHPRTPTRLAPLREVVALVLLKVKLGRERRVLEAVAPHVGAATIVKGARNGVLVEITEADFDTVAARILQLSGLPGVVDLDSYVARIKDTVGFGAANGGG